MQHHAWSADSVYAMARHLEGGGAAQGRQDGRTQDHEVHACQAPRLCTCTHVCITQLLKTGLVRNNMGGGWTEGYPPYPPRVR